MDEPSEQIRVLTFEKNQKSFGFNIFTDLILLALKDIKERKQSIESCKIENYYDELSRKYEIKEKSIFSNIRTAVTLTNVYGTGITPKKMLRMILERILKEGK